jgi:hypothetical protein
VSGADLDHICAFAKDYDPIGLKKIRKDGEELSIEYGMDDPGALDFMAGFQQPKRNTDPICKRKWQLQPKVGIQQSQEPPTYRP